jgi:hypothetical protein
MKPLLLIVLVLASSAAVIAQERAFVWTAANWQAPCEPG